MTRYSRRTMVPLHQSIKKLNLFQHTQKHDRRFCFLWVVHSSSNQRRSLTNHPKGSFLPPTPDHKNYHSGKTSKKLWTMSVIFRLFLFQFSGYVFPFKLFRKFLGWYIFCGAPHVSPGQAQKHKTWWRVIKHHSLYEILNVFRRIKKRFNTLFGEKGG